MRILWIDDEPSRAELLLDAQRALVNNSTFPPLINQDTLFFAHGFEQVAYYTRQAWDMILLDGDMPGMDGWDVANTFLTLLNVPVVIVSLNESKAKRIEALLEEFSVPCFRCPISAPKNLLRTIRMMRR